MGAIAKPLGAMERVLIGGDLSQLNEQERLDYYKAICDSLGLNPLTKPFAYLHLNGKLQLYALRDCADQLRKLHNVSVQIVARESVEGVYVVTARARMPDGREDESVGAVPIVRESDGKQNPLRPDDRANAMMKAECVPLDSEILTRSGWLKYDKVYEGDEVLAYDCASDTCRWTPLLAITVHDSLPMVKMLSHGGQFEVRCTPDHSWAVRKTGYVERATERTARGAYASRKPDRALIKASELYTHHSIILAAPERDATESALTPVEAAILGWAVTDGTIQKRGTYRRVGICQSKEENFEHIRELVGVLHPGFREIVSKPITRTFPMSGRTYDTLAQHWWYLPAQVSRDLLNKAGFEEAGRDALPNLATRLSSPARKAMLQAMMLAEGDARGIFANADRRILDTFQILCALEGKATGQEHDRGAVIVQRLKATRHAAMSFIATQEIGPMAAWCPTTEYGTWVMRQNGRVMITGNTKSKRRVTLSICGLGMLDESELDTIAEVRARQSHTQETVKDQKLAQIEAPSQLPKELEDLFGPDAPKRGTTTAFEMCKRELIEADPDIGETEYQRLLEHNGIKREGGNPIAKVRQCVTQMWVYAQSLKALKAKSKPNWDLGVSEDDIPDVGYEPKDDYRK